MKTVRKKKIAGLALLTIMLAMPMTVSLAKAVTWVLVTGWSGSAFPDSAQFTTDTFNCTHVEWRIRWSYTAVGSPLESAFIIQIYEEGVSDYINLIIKMGYISRSGVKDIHNNSGAFYFEVDAVNIEDYIIIVEQDVDSIPEFTPATLIIALTAVSIFVVALSKFRHSQEQKVKT